jgi:hypothetical protein
MGDKEVVCCLNNVNKCVNSYPIAKKEDGRAENVAQIAEHLPSKHKTLT